MVTRVPTRSRISSSVQPVFDSIRPFSYSLEKRYAAPSISVRMSSPSIRAICWEKSAAKGIPRVRHSSVCRIIASGSSAPISDEVEAADPVGDGVQLDQPGLAHRAGVEGADLVVVGVGGAHEARGVQHLGDAHRVGVHAVPVEPGAVLVEVVARRRRPGSARCRAAPMPKQMFGADTAAPDVELVDQEGEGDRVQLVGDQLVGEAAGEGHQVVGGDGAGDCDTHGVAAPANDGKGTVKTTRSAA